MKLFKKKILPHKMSWDDITVRQYNQIKNLDLTQIEDQITAAEILLNIKADDMTWVEFGKELRKLDFLSKPMPKTIIRFSYTLNGRKYVCNPNPVEMSVSQFMDYSEAVKTGCIEKILAVFLIPEGKEYADYDINQVYEDILDMSVQQAEGLLGFFPIVARVLSRTLADYSIKMLKKGKVNPEVINTIRMTVEELSNMDSCSI